ncbi:MAG: phosphocarrier protein HPr [Candidatus Cloacimonas sp. 4484_209]|nr:MAG: phosphocarrier protein HPr [Candidatus Cloacimonas sp. 4484_209]
MVKRVLTIENKLGLHARPASLFVKTAGQFESDITIEKDGVEVNGKSIMGIMMLAAEQGSEIILTAKGPDEKEAIDALVQLITKRKFDED